MTIKGEFQSERMTVTATPVDLPGLLAALKTFLTCRPAGHPTLEMWVMPGDEAVTALFGDDEQVTVVLRKVDPALAGMAALQRDGPMNHPQLPPVSQTWNPEELLKL